MISTVDDNDKKIIGYCEWEQVGRSGFKKPFGEYVYVANIWIHPSFRDGRKIMKQLIDDVLSKSVGAEYCYFQRKKYHNRLSRLYSREDFEKLLMKGALSVI